MTSTIKVNTVKDTASTDIIKKCGTSITVGTASDTTTVAGNAVRSNAIQASDGQNIISQVGATITLGATGDNIVLAGGATQSGFGRTGTVDWQTAIKTGDFTAVSGEGYFVNTTSGAITMTLPASPSAGDIVSAKDYAATFDSNALTIGRNGSNFNGGSDLNPSFNTEGQFLTFIYADATKGWLVTDNSQDNTQAASAYIAATGGTIVTSSCGNFKTHVFTGPGTFCVTAGAGPLGIADYFVVAGGGGSSGEGNGVGGGGAGGFRVSNGYSIPAPTMSPLVSGTSIPVSAGAISIAVGAGGAGTAAPEDGNPGAVSTFSTITSAGGGGGNRYNTSSGAPGGSGGGGGGSTTSPGPANPTPGGTGNTPPVSPPQGNNGGGGFDGRVTNTNGGGGGGAGATGGNSSAGTGGNGGAGSFIADGFVGPTAPSYGTPGPVGSTRYFGGGGAGSSNGPTQGSSGGAGGGPYGANGTTNTGGGSGGGSGPGANGGSGIVMIRYKFQ